MKKRKGIKKSTFLTIPQSWLLGYLVTALLLFSSALIEKNDFWENIFSLGLLVITVLYLKWRLNIFRFLPGYIDPKIIGLLFAVYFFPLGLFFILILTFDVLSNDYIQACSILFTSSWFLWHVFSLTKKIKIKKAKYSVAVYGAGVAGRELIELINRGSRYSAKYFIDDDHQLVGKHILGLKVLNWEQVLSDWHELEVDMIFVAIPSLSKEDRDVIINKLTQLPISLKFLPHVDDLIGSSVSLSELQSVSISDILHRPEADSILSEDTEWLIGKNALVTGGGGSIGLELSSRLVKSGISKLCIIDHSEIAIVEAEKKISELCDDSNIDCDIEYYLGSASDEKFVSNIFVNSNFDFVFHAAAYKHVPVLEDNEIQGVKNNLKTTEAVLHCAVNLNVKNFVLISTDKAVRPANIMGSSKRLCEALCLASNEKYPKTKISVVRFGNVLGSSGSVLPQFESQINQGGPVTVTHMDIERYFMSISEAASLVIQSTQIEGGSRLFVLDMGEPVKILDFAKKLIRLHGYKPYISEFGEAGTMEIEISGLRSGEKLYEELSIGKLSPTRIKKLYKANENIPTLKELMPLISEVEQALIANDSDALRKAFSNDSIGLSIGETNNED